jgi:POT family proton-dependent oligopeptide transporter
MNRNDDSSESQSVSFTKESFDSPKQHTGDLRRVKDSVPWRLWIVALIVFWERAAFWGLLAPWRTYISLVLSDMLLCEKY